MTKEQKAKIAQRLTEWEADKLLQAYVYYFTHWNPIDFDACDKFKMIQAEILRRMA